MGHGKVDAAIIDPLINLEIISVMGIGYDGVDDGYPLKKRVRTKNKPLKLVTVWCQLPLIRPLITI